ncbi:Transmembrane osmosensor [Tulasnella sp. 408]|nr:Transmembrane osmosensor [Tulasnella sp. 408]
MADSYPEPKLFKGTNPEECEALVATIRRHALERGKQNDNEWIALFASSYLAGDALYWYEDLEESIQKDWSRLRPALLTRFGRRSSSTTATSGLSATIPTPAAAPPATTSYSPTRKGSTTSTKPPGSMQGGQSPRTPLMGAAIGSIGSTEGSRARTLYNYNASPDDPNEISFSKGETLEILDDSGKWWHVRKQDGTRGIAPSNFLYII